MSDFLSTLTQLQASLQASLTDLHPYLADVDIVQLAGIAIISWLGAVGITRGQLLGR